MRTVLAGCVLAVAMLCAGVPAAGEAPRAEACLERACCGGLSVEGDLAVAEHRLGRLEAKGVSDSAQVRWRVPAGLSVWKHGRVLVFTGEPGAYRVELLVIDFERKAFEETEVNVTIGGRDFPAPPVPPPAPKPPEPKPPEPKPPEKPAPKAEPAKALLKLRVGSAGCTATVIGPRRPDGRWDILTASHCLDGNSKGTVTTQDGRVLKVTKTAQDASADLCWLVTDDAVESLPFATLAAAVPASGTAVWHAGYGVHVPGNREDGKVLGQDGQQVRMSLSVSSGDSGGGIFRSDTNELIASVCCTRSKGSVATMWGGSSVRAIALRPAVKAADVPPPLPLEMVGAGE